MSESDPIWFTTVGEHCDVIVGPEIYCPLPKGHSGYHRRSDDPALLECKSCATLKADNERLRAGLIELGKQIHQMRTDLATPKDTRPPSRLRTWLSNLTTGEKSQ